MDKGAALDRATFAGRMREARQARGMSPEELAYRAGLSLRTIAGLERQEHLSHFATVVLVAEILDVSLDWLAWGEGSMSRRPPVE